MKLETISRVRSAPLPVVSGADNTGRSGVKICPPTMFLERTDVHVALGAIDVFCWLLASFALVAFRYDFELSSVQWSSIVVYSVVAATAQILVGCWVGVYRSSTRVGSFTEASNLGLVTLAVGFIVGLGFLVGVENYPRGVAFLAPFLALLLMGAARFAARAVAVKILHRQKARSAAESILIYGAGNAGRQAGSLFFADPDSKFHVVGLIDDDPRKARRRFDFGRVIGGREELASKAHSLGVESVLVAIPTASADFLRDLSGELDVAGLKMLVLPPYREWLGGPLKLSDKIPMSSPDVGQAEEHALVRAIRSGWVAPLGPEVDAFEQELAQYSGRKHAVALSSGTAALHLALLSMDVGPGDLVLTSTMTFAATANAIKYTGAEPVFVDADQSGNMNPDLLKEALAMLAREGRGAKAVVPVDLFGKVANHERIGAISAAYGVPVLSDAAESLGATRDGRAAASFGVAAALSFNGNKIMTTSGGGALLTDDAAMAQRVLYFATQARQPAVHYQHTEVGYNYRMSNVLAALGRAQLGRLDSMIERRRRMRAHYRDLFADVPGVSIFGEPSGVDGGLTRDNFWLSSILIDSELAGFTSEDMWSALSEANVEARPLWKPMHCQPVFADARAFTDGTSERLFRAGLCLPSGSALKDEDIERIDNVITSFVSGKSAAA